MITVASKSNPNVTAEYKVTVRNLAGYIAFQNYDKLRLEPDEYEQKYFGETVGTRKVDLDFNVYPETAENKNYNVISDNTAVIEAKNAYDENGDSVCTLILKSKGKATLTIKSDDGYVTEKWTITVGDKDLFYVEGVSDPQP